MPEPTRDHTSRFGIAGFALACLVGCCAGPVLAAVGVGTVSGAATLLLGASGIVVAAITIIGLVGGRRLNRRSDADNGPVQVTLTSRDASSDRTC